MQNKNIKIVYIITDGLTPRWESYFCIDEMAREFDVEYWNCAAVAKPRFNSSSFLERSYTITVDSFKTLKKQLKRLPKDTILVIDAEFMKENFHFHKFVSKWIINCVHVDLFSLTVSQVMSCDKNTEEHQTLSPFKRIKKFLYNFDLIRIVCKSIRHGLHYNIKEDVIGYKKLREAKEYYHYRNKCLELYHNYYISYKPSAKYTINHPDYEKYLSIKDLKDTRTDKYIVYLDQFYPLHSDYPLNEPNVDFTSLTDPFYHSINRFFDLVESQTGCKIVIAAHPVANYIDSNPFKGREVVYYKTAELVRDAQAVCSMCSNSISFVMLFNKPFATIGCQASQASPRFGHGVKSYAKAIGEEFIDMDKVENVTNVFKPIKPNIRERYLSEMADLSNTKRNPELYKENLIKIHDDIMKRMYDKNQ